MADRGAYDEDDVLARYLVWARSSPKDIGATVSHALARASTPAAGPRRGRRLPRPARAATAPATAR